MRIFSCNELYLTGVNREKEPLTGTSPERLLYERSLQKSRCSSYYHPMTSISYHSKIVIVFQIPQKIRPSNATDL